MQKLMIIALIFCQACTSSKELVTSDNLKPKCHCIGNGQFTLVMEAGMGNWSVFYQPLINELQPMYRICIVDRVGYGMDSVSTSPRDLVTVAKELQSTLQKLDVNQDIVLLGHSLGGLYLRMYQKLYPDQVKGLVLIDAAHPDQFARLPSPFLDMFENQPKQLDDVINIAKKGYLKYSKGRIPTFGLPMELLEDYYKVSTNPEYYHTMKKEIEAFKENLVMAGDLDSLGELPLLVIASKQNMDKSILPIKDPTYPFDEHNKIWLQLQKELAALSSNSTFVALDENHYLHVVSPHLVATELEQWMKDKILVY